MNTSAFKKTVMCIMFVFAVQLAVVPAQTLYAGCAASATKSVITLGVVGVSLVIADFLFTGGVFTAIALAKAGAATVGGAAVALAAKGAAGAAVTGCAESLIFDKPSQPSPSR